MSAHILDLEKNKKKVKRRKNKGGKKLEESKDKKNIAKWSE